MVFGCPEVRYFKPRGIPMKDLTEVYLTLEGYEALRLVDLEGLGQEEAAQNRAVSRQTFGRILADARRSVSEAIVKGLALRIEGGDYAFAGKADAAQPNESEKVSLLNLESDLPIITQTGAKLMKTIAVSAEGPSLDDPIDPRFGRAAGFLLVDPDTLATEYIDNGASQARGQGAGIQAAETIARAGAKVVLTGFVGPNAFGALKAAGIQVGQNLDGLTVRQAIEKYKNNEVTMSSAPNSPGGRR
jgi:predicted DNA-binding protein (UPF0251 family)/predicted Fe-Mo cluster-binding NifX family protein